MIKLFSTAKVVKIFEINIIFYIFFACLNKNNYLCSKNLRICVKIKKNWIKFGN
jgi:hypothetical protein